MNAAIPLTSSTTAFRTLLAHNNLPGLVETYARGGLFPRLYIIPLSVLHSIVKSLSRSDLQACSVDLVLVDRNFNKAF